MPDRVVAVLGRGVVPADTPILRADDLGALRGDGIFETMHVRPAPPGLGHAAQPWLIEEHLARMVRSANRMGLPLPNATELRDLAHKALAEWPADTEAALRMVCTRGGEDGGSPTVYVTVAPVSEATKRARREGISIITASLGMRFDARSTAPWLLGGAKTLSYAVNMASLRFATGQGVDDVLWVSSDGYALEAPTSTLLWLSGGTVWTVPADLTGILAGTTARWLLAQVDSIGLTAGERLVRPDELAEADGIWLTSSIRGLAEVRGLDGASRKPSPYTEELSNLLGHPR